MIPCLRMAEIFSRRFTLSYQGRAIRRWDGTVGNSVATLAFSHSIEFSSKAKNTKHAYVYAILRL
jgi:hypothetical protein